MALPARRFGRLEAAVVTMRPRQWIKNALVFAAAAAAGALGRDNAPIRVTLAFVAFCLLASGIYAINDVHDAPEDRLNPRKRSRPIAAGELEPTAAIVLALALVASGLALCSAVRPMFLLVGLGYVALTVSYTLLWRKILLLDILAVAGGFVLRAVAGGVAAHVTLSAWFLIVVTSAALLLAAGKRQAEFRRIQPDPASFKGRHVLRRYNSQQLRLIMVASAIAALTAYAAWALQLPIIRGIPWRLLTIIPFSASVLRYGQLVRNGEGEAPEDLLADHRLLFTTLLWLALFAFSVQASAT